ncbi:MAG TPA: mannose-6-phosphate isomerase, class I [Kineosporiaceae bacterium]|nr:mannose-6-phosphate isomerase, class I [Kineosporiaceae bacterium]
MTSKVEMTRPADRRRTSAGIGSAGGAVDPLPGLGPLGSLPAPSASLDGAIVLGDPATTPDALVLGEPGPLGSAVPVPALGRRARVPAAALAATAVAGTRVAQRPGGHLAPHDADTAGQTAVREPGDLLDLDLSADRDACLGDPFGEGADDDLGRGPGDVPRLEWTWPLRMVNPVRSHGWGSASGLAGVQRRPAGRRPEAELWIGAHPVASSALVDSEGREVPLLEAVDCDPEGLLGRPHRNRFGARLPFLLKVIAVERAMAVQVHPVRRQAAEGFARQEAAGIPLRSAARTFVDPHAKPELLLALTPFDALIGLREPRHCARLIELLDVAPLLPLRRVLGAAAATGQGASREGTVEALVRLAAWPFRQRAVLAAGVSDAARAALVNPVTAHRPDTRTALEWVIRLADQHPGDPLVLAPLFLEYVHLEPGQSAFVPPGVLHTFLRGVALEAAASSANVIRAGLTRRPVDPEAVQAAVEVAARPLIGVGEEQTGRHETTLLAPAEEFRLSRIALAGTGVVAPSPRPAGPQIMLCLDGEVEVGVGARLAHLCSGESAFLGPQARDVVLSGEGTVYRITAGG